MKPASRLVEPIGIEPMTFALQTQTLSQLSYGPSLKDRIMQMHTWWVWEELHPRPHPYQGCALTN